MSAETEGRTEKPTQKQKEKFRNEGQVAKSVEVNTLAQYVMGFIMLSTMGPLLFRRMMETLSSTFGNLSQHIVNFYPIETMQSFALHVMLVLTPVFLFLWLGVFLANVAQFGFKVSWKAIQPKMQKFNVIANLKNQLFSMKSIIELAKSLIKIFILSFFIYKVAQSLFEVYPQLFYFTPAQSGIFIWSVIKQVWWVFIIFMLILGAVDGWWQRHQLNEKMKMTPSQVKDEYKQREGDPHVKRQIKSRQFRFIQELMKKNMSEADVVITNPTHFAVALSYKHGSMNVPKVVAKGVDHLALSIRKTARNNSIPIVENRRIARSLYFTTDIDQEIPEEFYRPVAEILAFVFRLNSKKRAAT